jgi:hypothetical protein
MALRTSERFIVTIKVVPTLRVEIVLMIRLS